jgi:hypothetical protein
MFGCCKTRKITPLIKYTFENGTVVYAYNYEDAMKQVRDRIKDDDPKTSWAAYLDFRDRD